MENTGPWRITFDTNPDDCNLKCIMCEDHSPYSTTQRDRINSGIRKHRMPIELIEKIISEAKLTGLKEIIPSTMGEPLLYKHFEKILELCHQYQIKLNLTTNGTFPIKGVDAWAKLIIPVTSDVKISWNGATKQTQESIMLGSNWEKVLQNVKSFIAIRDQYAKEQNNYCRVTFQLTFLDKNVDELADIVKLAIQLGVDRVKGHHLWVHFNEIADSDLRQNESSVARWNKAVRNAQSIADKYRLPNGNSILLENIRLIQSENALASYQGECPFLGKEAWIDTEGRFNPCCAPDKERRTLGDFGNLNNTSLASIWQSQNYQDLQKSYFNNPVCKKCNMRKPVIV